MKIITTLLLLFSSLAINAQQILKQEKYTGTIDGKINISFYLKLKKQAVRVLSLPGFINIPTTKLQTGFF